MFCFSPHRWWWLCAEIYWDYCKPKQCVNGGVSFYVCLYQGCALCGRLALLSLLTIITLSKHYSSNHNNHLHISLCLVVYFSSLWLLLISILFYFRLHTQSFPLHSPPSFSNVQVEDSGYGSIKIPGGWSSRGHARGYAAETCLYD